MIKMIRASLDNLNLDELMEVLTSVQYQCGLSTEQEAREKIEAGEYTKEEIMQAIAYKRTDGMGSHDKMMEYLPISLIGVVEDYTGLIY